MRFKALVVVVIALVALVGCSKNSPTPDPAHPAGPGTATAAANAGGGGGGGGGTIDPCSLITTEEATAVLGEPAKDGVPHAFQQTRQCQWDSANASIAILVYLGGQKDPWPSTHDLAKSAYSAKFSDVSGLGDAAFSNGIDLHILKGDDMYQIGVLGPFTDRVGKAMTVAKEALARA
jgi:uncharacterized protein DUF3558